MALDAIARVGYRRLISRRDLLQWTAQATHWSAARRQPLFVASLALGSLFSVIAGVAIWRFMPASLPQAAPWLLLWLLSPLLGWLLNLRPALEQRAQPLPETDRRFLRTVARRTWRYFSTFVNAKTSWLPPDNYQVAHQNRLAMRTSPTNIGLWLTSALGAHDAGYLTINQVVEKLASSMATIGRLQRHEGHLLNWYDIQTLAPLEPRYVSTVDSGNLLGALWALEQGLAELLHAPLLEGRAFAGLADTGDILMQSTVFKGSTGLAGQTLTQLLAEWQAPPTGIVALLRLQRRMQIPVGTVVAAAGGAPWGAELEQQVAAAVQNSDRYLRWIEILAEKTEEELAPLGPALLAAIRQDLAQAPSLSALAHGRIGSIPMLRALREESLAAGASRRPLARPGARGLRHGAVAGRGNPGAGRAADRRRPRAGGRDEPALSL